jgi:chemotaxis regulatin CheY-phosphate phosphatase CheZ
MTNKETKIRELSDKIDAFQYDADPYEYMDACSTIEEISANLDRIDKAITDKSKGLIDYLMAFTDDDNDTDIIVRAMDLIQEIKTFWKE